MQFPDRIGIDWAAEQQMLSREGKLWENNRWSPTRMGNLSKCGFSSSSFSYIFVGDAQDGG